MFIFISRKCNDAAGLSAIRYQIEVNCSEIGRFIQRVLSIAKLHRG